jgi:PEP-CTERM motif
MFKIQIDGSFFRLLGFVLLACAASKTSNAGTILYSNSGDSFTTNSQLTEVLYQSFSNGPSSLSLDDLKLVLDVKGTDTGTFTVGLYSDSSTAPGTLLLNIANVNDTSLTLTPTTYDFPVADFALAANTRYWIGLIPSGSIQGSWESSNPQGGDTGVSGQFADYGGTVFGPVSPSTAPAFQMIVDAVVPQQQGTAPEPSSGILLAAGLAAAWWARRTGATILK